MRTCKNNGFKLVGVYDKNVWAEEKDVIALCNYYLDKDSKYIFDIDN